MEQVNPSKKIHSLIINTLKSKFLSPVGKTSNLLITLRSEVALFSTGSTKSVMLPFCSHYGFWQKQDSHFSFFSRKKEKILRFNSKAAVLI